MFNVGLFINFMHVAKRFGECFSTETSINNYRNKDFQTVWSDKVFFKEAFFVVSQSAPSSEMFPSRTKD